MIVLYDYQTFEPKVGGVSRVIAEIIKHHSSNVTSISGVKVSDNFYIKDLNLNCKINEVPLTSENFISKKHFKGQTTLFKYAERIFPFLPTFRNLNLKFSVELLSAGDFDLFHYPMTVGSDYFLPFIIGKKPFVLTVHDMISEIYYQPNNPQSLLKAKLVKVADHIIVISKQTKNDLMRILNVPEDKITVVYHGAPEKHCMAPRLINEEYFLYVGRRGEYKNSDQTLKDFSEFYRNHQNVKFIMVGGPFTSLEKKLISELGIDNAVYTILATDEELASLYHYAIAFIYPSLYEGFGLPILEAYTYQSLLLCNRTSCLPEIAGDAAIYFNSKPGTSDLPEKMEEVYNMSKEARSTIIAKENERCTMFSWDKAAKQTEIVYQNVLKQYHNFNSQKKTL